MTGRRDDRGTVTLELVLLAPLLIMLMLLMYAFGLYAHTESLVDQAARDGVRAATQSRSPGEADEMVDSVVTETMSDAVTPCLGGPDVAWGTSDGDFTAPPPISEDMNFVEVTVSCTVDLGNASFLPFLGETTLERTFLSPLDTFRGYYP